VQLTAGQNFFLPEVPGVRVNLTWAANPDIDADLSALLLQGGKVLSSDHFVFYNQAASPDGAVTHVGKNTSQPHVVDSIDVALAALPADVQAVVLAVSAHPSGPGALAQLGQPEVSVVDPHGNVLASHRLTSMTSESALNVIELYRRAGAWKVRAVGQGWNDGLAGLARDFGVEVDDEDPSDAELHAEAEAPARNSGGRVGADWSNPPVPTGYEI
jgi:stress response protein SCP2